MCEGTDYLNANPDKIADMFLAVSRDLNELAAEYPLANEWFIEQGYSFEFGMVGEAFLVRHGRIVQGPLSGPGSAADLFSSELKSLIEQMVGETVD